MRIKLEAKTRLLAAKFHPWAEAMIPVLKESYPQAKPQAMDPLTGEGQLVSKQTATKIVRTFKAKGFIVHYADDDLNIEAKGDWKHGITFIWDEDESKYCMMWFED